MMTIKCFLLKKIVLLPRSFLRSAGDVPDSSILDEDAHAENQWEKLFFLLENGQYADILRWLLGRTSSGAQQWADKEKGKKRQKMEKRSYVNVTRHGPEMSSTCSSLRVR